MAKYGPKKLDKVDIQTTELVIHPHPYGDHLINIIDDNKTDIDDNYTVTFVSNTPNIEFYLSDIISIIAYTDIVVD